MRRNCKFVCVVSAVLGLMSTVSAQESITLRMGTFLPATNYGITEGSNVFMSELDRLTDGRVKIEFYPAQQAGKARESLELTKYGAIDIAEIGTGYYSNSDVPLWGLLEAPNLVKSVCDGTRAMRAVGDPGGILWDTQYEPMGLRVLSYYVYPPYGPSASNRKITSVDDIVGLKMRNAGGLMERTVAALGGVPIALTGPEVMQALQRGTLDSWMGAFSSVKAYEYYLYADYGATGFSMGTPGIFAMISESKFQSFPPDIQEALIEAGRTAEEHFCAYTDKEEVESIQQLQTAKYGMEIYTWTPDQVAELSEKTANVVDSWVMDLEARGLPAGDALKAYKAALPSK